MLAYQLLFNVFIADTEEKVKLLFSKFVEFWEAHGIRRTIKQNNPERNSVNCTQANSMDFSKVLDVRLNSGELASQA